MYKQRMFVPLLILCCAVLACKLSGSSSNSNSFSPERTASTPKTPSLNDEAGAAVKDLWEQHATKCGDSYYASEDFRGIITLHQYKNVAFVAYGGGPTSDADRLNGILWNGRVLIQGLYRDNHEGTWAEWHQYTGPNERIFEVGATKRESGWSVVQLLAITDLRKVKCSEMPA